MSEGRAAKVDPASRLHVEADRCEVLPLVNITKLVRLNCAVLGECDIAPVADLKLLLSWPSYVHVEIKMAAFILGGTHEEWLFSEQVDEDANHVATA